MEGVVWRAKRRGGAIRVRTDEEEQNDGRGRAERRNDKEDDQTEVPAARDRSSEEREQPRGAAVIPTGCITVTGAQRCHAILEGVKTTEGRTRQIRVRCMYLHVGGKVEALDQGLAEQVAQLPREDEMRHGCVVGAVEFRESIRVDTAEEAGRVLTFNDWDRGWPQLTLIRRVWKFQPGDVFQASGRQTWNWQLTAEQAERAEAAMGRATVREVRQSEAMEAVIAAASTAAAGSGRKRGATEGGDRTGGPSGKRQKGQEGGRSEENGEGGEVSEAKQREARTTRKGVEKDDGQGDEAEAARASGEETMQRTDQIWHQR